MKIVYFIDHLRPDGTQKMLVELVRGLAQLGHCQSIVCINDSWNGEILQELINVGAQVKIIGKSALLSGYGLMSLSRWLHNQRFDVAVTMLFYADVLGRFLSHYCGIPKIVSSLRARNLHYSVLQRWLLQATSRWVDIAVLNSIGIRNFAISEEGIKPECIRVIHNGIEINKYQEAYDKKVIKSELAIPPSVQVVGCVGRLDEQKGFDLLLEAMHLVHDKTVHVILVGDGPQRSYLYNKAISLGFESRLHLLGWRNDIPRILSILDLYVQPSRYEGMPNALLEAMAAGCPVIASAVDGNCELVENEVSGWLFPPENFAILAERIDFVLNHVEEAKNTSYKAIDRVEQQFSMKAMITSWNEVLIH